LIWHIKGKYDGNGMFFYKNGEKKYDGQYTEGISYELRLIKYSLVIDKIQIKPIKVKEMEMVHIMR
jgi:hypothetical protein